MAAALVSARRRAQPDAAISFDVFDTFLMRACTTPIGVFERTYQLSRISTVCPNVSDNFVQHRILAESRARQRAKQRRGSGEVGIAEIYSGFPFRLFGLDQGAAGEFIDAEFSAEIELCRTNPDMLRQYRDNRREGQRVGFISDTYWGAERLGRLLRACSPDLQWDFLYASCDHGSAKGEALFARYLAEQGIDAERAFHIGDNEHADIAGARRHGIRSRHYPQASAALMLKLERESALFDLFFKGQASRLDHGSRSLRRMVAMRSAETTPAHHLGVTVVGPVMAAFNAFVAARWMQLAGDGRRVAIGFLGRDGYLPYQVWQQAGGGAASYLEVNRRVGIIASADTIEPICELLRKIPKVDVATLRDMLKILPKPVAAFLARYPGGVAPGNDLADALPELFAADDIAALAVATRERLTAHLRHEIEDFDNCTDLILVDLGYSGSVQKALRRVLDIESSALRLHGCYLLALDEAVLDLADGDSAAGFISDLVVTPHVNRTLIRNVAVLEQICCANEGSVRDYQHGRVLREDNPVPPAQAEIATAIRDGVLAYTSEAGAIATELGLAPHRDLAVAARWCAVTLGRLLLLPDDDELALLGGFQHDVNLGTTALAPMIDGAAVGEHLLTRGRPAACAAAQPPMWVAGSFAMLSPADAYLYALFGVNLLPAELFNERPAGVLGVGLFGRDGTATMQQAKLYRCGQREWRVRIPLSRAMAIATIAVPLGKVAREGLLEDAFVQRGDSIAKAALGSKAGRLDLDQLVAAGIARHGRHYQVQDQDGCLLLPVDHTGSEFAIYTIAITSLAPPC